MTDTRLTSERLLDAHVHLNMGVFFDSLKTFGPLKVATSRTVPDIYWNFVYKDDPTPFTGPELDSVSDLLRDTGRSPAIWQNAGVAVPPGWCVASREAWMWISAKDWEAPAVDPGSAAVWECGEPTPSMVAVFEDAYSSGGQEGDVGYFQLPREYGQAYLHAHAVFPTKLRHFAIGQPECVAVGSACVWNGFGGIYSVATLHGQRRKGYGIRVSSSAVEWAFANGADGVMLQTEADSAVEAMYARVGFRRIHVGSLLVPT